MDEVINDKQKLSGSSYLGNPAPLPQQPSTPAWAPWPSQPLTAAKTQDMGGPQLRIHAHLDDQRPLGERPLAGVTTGSDGQQPQLDRWQSYGGNGDSGNPQYLLPAP